MRSALRLKQIIIVAIATALSACLVSEEPLLDGSTGKARPVAAGIYDMCPQSGDASDSDCSVVDISVDDTSLYRLQTDDDDVTLLRFLRVRRGAYAVQVGPDDGDDGYAYYFARTRKGSFDLTFMMCEQLPEVLRSKMIENGELTLQDGDDDTCTVNSIAGLKRAAKAYHRGDIEDEDESLTTLFTLQSDNSATP